MSLFGFLQPVKAGIFSGLSLLQWLGLIDLLLFPDYKVSSGLILLQWLGLIDLLLHSDYRGLEGL
jgi:hypothetical protein